ncbi:MAG: hypothetical protein ABSA65_16705 [Acidimicrobiales bacterium]|jgi:hypothetical protein
MKPFQLEHNTRTNSEPGIAPEEPNDCRALSFQAEADRDISRAELAGALEQVGYWRTLAEYRRNRLMERQDRSGGEADRC